MEKVHLVLELIGAVGTVCGLVSFLLPEGKWKEALSHLGIMFGKFGKALKK